MTCRAPHVALIAFAAFAAFACTEESPTAPPPDVRRGQRSPDLRAIWAEFPSMVALRLQRVRRNGWYS
jgi:hypothetical protein